MLRRCLLASVGRRSPIALLLAFVVVAGSAGLFERRAAADTTESADLGVMTIVVGGLDSREPGQPENTDVLILARVDVPNRTVRTVIIPRDLYVEIPGFGYDKITRAYDHGSKAQGGDVAAGVEAGMALVKQTVAANFGIEADGIVLTTFDGFVKIVNALGGLDLVNPYDLYDAEYPTPDYGTKEIYYPAGPLHLTGEEALEFVRTRHQDSDDGRVMRQQLVLRAMLERARDPELAPRLPRLIETTREAVRTDLTLEEQLALALAAPDFTNENVSFATVNGFLYSDYAPNGMWIYSADWSLLPGYVQGVLDGTVE
jgi:LCP family protein required for cell wall assembly